MSRALAVALIMLASCAGSDGDSPDRPPSTVVFSSSNARLFVEIADEADEQRRGLMGVENLPADQGMAFVWPEPVGSTFWMKNTLVALSIAFVDDAGQVLDVLDMQPCEADPCRKYGIDEPYVLAVEANLGWFDDHRVHAGDRAELRPSLYG